MMCDLGISQMQTEIIIWTGNKKKKTYKYIEMSNLAGYAIKSGKKWRYIDLKAKIGLEPRLIFGLHSMYHRFFFLVQTS